MKPEASAIRVGMWNAGIVGNVRKFDAFNRQPIEVTKDQLGHLYLLLYPMMASEFVHRTDMYKYIEMIMQQQQQRYDELNKKFIKLKNQLDMHTHIGNMGLPTSNPRIAPAQPVEGFQELQIELWTAKPEDSDFKSGEGHIVKATDTVPALQQRNKLPAEKVLNTADEYKIEEQVKIIHLPPFDIEEEGIEEPDDFSL